MFDIFSKFGEIKDKAMKAKEELETKEFSVSDSKNTVIVKSNGKKDILSIELQAGFSNLSFDEQEIAVNEATKKALSESQNYFLSVVKNVVPNIPGLNIFG
jgi:DNA-binding protein YbaB